MMLGRLTSLLASAWRGGIVGAWYALRLARIERRLEQIELHRQQERCVHNDQMHQLRQEEDRLHDARIIAMTQAASYWRAVR